MSKAVKVAITAGVIGVGYYLYTLYTTIKNIDFQFRNFQVYKVDKNGLTFRLKLIIDNSTGTRNLHIRGARFKFYMDNTYISTVSLHQECNILAGQADSMDFMITLRWLQFGGLLLNTISNETVNISMNGAINIGLLTAPIPTMELTNVNITQSINDIKNDIITAGQTVASWF